MDLVTKARRRVLVGIALAAACRALCASAWAQSVADFYSGKTVTLYIGYSAGGGYDAYARLVARFMGDHIPGKPQIVPSNMPGAGSRNVARFVYTAAPKDGTVLATGDQSLALQQALGDKTVAFDTSKFGWVGSPNSDNNVLVTWHTTGVTTIDQAKQKVVSMGATGPNTSAQYPEVMNDLLGTKFKIVTGYPGGNDINLAMERGEVGGRGSNNYVSWKATRPDWLRDHKLNILVQIGLKKSRELPDVPLLLDLGQSEQDKRVLKLLSAPVEIGRPIFTTPGVPPERLAALRKAFDETMEDPAFLAQAKKENLDIDPVDGKELQQVVEDVVNAPKPVADRLAKIINDPNSGSGR